MSVSQRQAVITLIKKEGKDCELIENWRPISLINVDAKLITKSLASRIQKVLPKLISENQYAYTAERNIKEAIRIIGDVL